jgi:hypothetical protein
MNFSELLKELNFTADFMPSRQEGCIAFTPGNEHSKEYIQSVMTVYFQHSYCENCGNDLWKQWKKGSKEIPCGECYLQGLVAKIDSGEIKL